MVDEKDNHIDRRDSKTLPGWELPVLLLGAFRSIVDDAHDLLEQRGHPGLRPVHGFTLQAIGIGATASDLGERLGVSKQAAAKTLATLDDAGYVTRAVDPRDARRKVAVLTAKGQELLDASADAFGDVVQRWADTVGYPEVAHLHETLLALNVAGAAGVDLGAWSGCPPDVP